MGKEDNMAARDHAPTTGAGSALPDLLARVRAAEGPSREIDCALACALDGFWVELAAYPNQDGTILRADFCRTNEDGGWSSPGHGGDQMVRAYTASLDAALALVERVLPGWHWEVGKEPDKPLFSAWVVRDDGTASSGETWAPTPALALLAALLTALIVTGNAENRPNPESP